MNRPEPTRAFITFLLAAGSFLCLEVGRAVAEEDRRKPVRAVVELFASQSCSACPPAMDLMASLSADPTLIGLTLPVDYWNYLGWKDTLAKPEFTTRQRDYASARGDRQVYTPQMVVNGKVACVGGRLEAITGALAATSHGRSELPVALGVRFQNLSLVIEVAAGEGPADVWLFAVRRRAVVSILGGENRGATLNFVNVVRAIRRVGSWDGAPATYHVDVDTGWQGDADSYVALLQKVARSGRPGEIIGAAR